MSAALSSHRDIPETLRPRLQWQWKCVTLYVCVSAEAGKIALNYIRQDALGDSSHEEAGLETVVGDDGQVSWKGDDGIKNLFKKRGVVFV